MEKIPISLWTLLAGLIVAAISISVGQNHHLLPEAASLQAPLVDDFFNVMLTIAIALFLIVEGTIVIFLILYRRKKGDNSDGVPIEGNIGLEIFWTAIPTIIVIGLGIYSVNIFNEMGGFGVSSHSHSMTQMAMNVSDHSNEANIGFGENPQTKNKPADIIVDVQGMQFAWIFNYPDTGISTGELHIPVGADVQLNLSANDVIHSFWVPQFRLKQDAIPGVPTQLRFVATKPGTYPVVCAELCGGYHGSMRTEVIVHEPKDYQNWIAENQLATQPEVNHLVAVNSEQFLAPYEQELGVKAATIHSLAMSHQ
ncbi:cytochrome c oxidase subunit II [Anabaena sp. FACHB-1237]|uniref:cytochrome c oxidase subunit II n=1 Tax=Anabaena sp. FACHB-1237 TaxID=2692769 RepID=UPI001680C10D|nr:cytochrome c oxidase subunit II [Anabaena sp. FACHB-1237]MBD2137825.1 cytochrome c oxidase subunit II [Anabaena sp. FACHB-1237]